MGKLIDADVFDGILKNAQEECKRNGGNFRFGVLNSVRENLANLPAVDAAPVVHGRWEPSNDYSGYCRCSICHDVYVDPAWVLDSKWSFCQNCGAKMDKEGGHENRNG